MFFYQFILTALIELLNIFSIQNVQCKLKRIPILLFHSVTSKLIRLMSHNILLVFLLNYDSKTVQIKQTWLGQMVLSESVSMEHVVIKYCMKCGTQQSLKIKL